MSELLPSRQNEGYGACDDEGGGLFPKTLFCREVSDYELPNSRAVQSERLLLSINPSAALNGRHLPLHKGGFGRSRASGANGDGRQFCTVQRGLCTARHRSPNYRA